MYEDRPWWAFAFLLKCKEKAVLPLWKACCQLNSSIFFVFPFFLFAHILTTPTKTVSCGALLESQGELVLSTHLVYVCGPGTGGVCVVLSAGCCAPAQSFGLSGK